MSLKQCLQSNICHLRILHNAVISFYVIRRPNEKVYSNINTEVSITVLSQLAGVPWLICGSVVT